MSHFDKLAYLTDEIAPRKTVTIPMLKQELEKTSEELQRQVEVGMTINQDWNHLKQEWSKQAPTEQIVIISRLVRAAAEARDSYLKLCTRYILLAKWLEKFPRIEEDPQSPERVWLDVIICMDMKGQMQKLEKVIEKLEKEERIVKTHLKTRNEEFHQAQRDHLQICRLQERLRETELELFHIKAKRARLEMGTEAAPPNPPETSKDNQHLEKEAATRDLDLPRLEDDEEEEEMELEEELMLIDEEEAAEENTVRHRQEDVIDDERYLDQLLQEAGETPQESEVSNLQREEEATERVEVVTEQAEEDVRRVQIVQEQRPQEPAEAEDRDDGPRQGQEEIQELQYQIQELEAHIQVTQEENRARGEEILKMERALQVLPRRYLYDAPERTQPNVTFAFCKAQNRHFSDSCYVVTDGDARYSLALEEGLCPRCLLGHGGRCRHPYRPCFYCERVSGTMAEEFRLRDEDHHKALCTIPNAESAIRQRIRSAKDEYIQVGRDIEQWKERRDDLRYQVEEIQHQNRAPRARL